MMPFTLYYVHWHLVCTQTPRMCRQRMWAWFWDEIRAKIHNNLIAFDFRACWDWRTGNFISHGSTKIINGTEVMEKFFDEKRRIKINNSCSRVKERERDPYRPSILCTLFANDKQTEDQRQRVKIFINRVTTIILYIYNIRLEYQVRVNEAHTHTEKGKKSYR